MPQLMMLHRQSRVPQRSLERLCSRSMVWRVAEIFSHIKQLEARRRIRERCAPVCCATSDVKLTQCGGAGVDSGTSGCC
ncbi:hypothetical protein DOTSEDRAFT_75631 [Dothistroma septosporum NZE10]|uniref:Uncharacterized protein n=1 Tax=Dothistroma septosporum (strain NZE10 / CBS 128990) TaxID=675120 RepID=M2WJ47_DOTSN|nr:hypothetical protein DOTSEDRAFT_75631 [Dothistroma septosporum NZE10]